MKKNLIYSIILLLSLASNIIIAQCPAAGSITLSTSSTPNTCAGNGSITATVNSTTGVSLQLLKSGTILSQVPGNITQPLTNPYTWSNLQPGTDYQVKVICSEDQGIVYQTANVTVADNYIPISSATINLSNVCTNFTEGGTITVSGVTGGTAPYTYSMILNNDPNYSESLSSYSASNTKNVAQFGTYQIRIKDACGNYKTFTKTISASLAPIEIYWTPKDNCSSSQNIGYYWYAINTSTGTAIIDMAPYYAAGVRMVIRDTNAAGAILYNGTYSGGSFNYTPNSSHIYYVTTTNACGLSTSYTHYLNNAANNPEYANFELKSSSSGCGASERMTINANFSLQGFMVYPVTITVKNSGGTTIHTSTITSQSEWSLGSLAMGNYTITATDSCGNTITKTATNPQSAGAVSVSLQDLYNWRCDVGALTQTGTLQALIAIGGYVPDRQNAVVTIVAGPSNVGVNAVYTEGYWGWTNILPGNYTIRITSCGISNNYSLNISFSPGLTQTISSMGTSFCSGGGNITSTVNYSGGYDNTVELLNSLGTVIATDITGNFSNLGAGTYSTRLKISPPCTSSYYVNGNTIILPEAGVGPQITSSVGVICEDALGYPLTTGTAYLNMTGVAPLTLKYREQGTGTWSTINNAANDLQISNLNANTIYELLLTDACGASYNGTVNIRTMGALTSQNTVHPCYNSPYVLSMRYYAGAAYEWYNSSGTLLSTTRNYSIPNYTAANDGMYTAKITWGTCVTRYVYLNINGLLCGNPINEVVDAVNDDYSTTPISGITGGNTTSVLANDTINTLQATLSNVTLSQVSTTHSGVNLNLSTGLISVAPGTPAGTYTVTYKICSVSFPTVCDTATAIVVVPCNAGNNPPVYNK